MNKQTQKFTDQVELFRKSTGLPLNSIQPNLNTHRKIIMEELSEVADAFADTIVTCLGLYLDTVCERTKVEMLYQVQNVVRCAAIMSIDIDEVMDRVQSANLSKVCSTMDIAKQTKAHYHSIGVSSYIRDMPDGSFAVFSSEDQEVNGKHYPSGKLLKSVNWFEPDYSDYSNWMLEYDFLECLY